MLKLYNTLTRDKREFVPIDPNNVRMYVCGPTVYDFAHIGNARPVIVFDVLYRLLRHLYPGPGKATDGSCVEYVRNITDVDDKINARAAERYPELAPELGIRKLTEETAAQFHKDIAALGVLPPTVEPRATEHIAEMVQLCDALVKNGHAYVAADHVLFDVSSMPDYGRLSNRSLDEMEAGARVEVAPYKKGPMDFVLWKPSKPGEPAWASPGGIKVPGRPGWHIECSAMACKHLGNVFDIHGGGIDLAFPHHENEIAQSRCAHGTAVMANVWMHNGFLQVEGEKMSKSLGNFITINELLETTKFGGRKWPGDTIRLQMLSAHYRQPLDWTVERALECERTVTSWVEAIGSANLTSIRSHPTNDVVQALSDDLNTSDAIAILHDRARTSGKSREASLELANNLAFLGVFRDYQQEVMPVWRMTFPDWPNSFPGPAGVLLDLRALELVRRMNLRVEMFQKVLPRAEAYAKYGAPNQSVEALERFEPESLNSLIDARLEARKRKDFKESDRIRDELAKMGIALKDSKDPKTGEIVTTWEVAR